MAWGQPHTAGTGSAQQIEDAHKAFDAVGVAPGPLAVRAMSAAGIIDRLTWCQCGLPPERHKPGHEMGHASSIPSSDVVE